MYVGPLKWIVCLVGSNGYSAGTFISSNQIRLQNMPNLSVSVMALSEMPLGTKTCREYRKLSEQTSEGTFCNLVDIGDKDKTRLLFEKFFGSMDVYPSEDDFGGLYIKEHFSIL